MNQLKNKLIKKEKVNTYKMKDLWNHYKKVMNKFHKKLNNNFIIKNLKINLVKEEFKLKMIDLLDL